MVLWQNLPEFLQPDTVGLWRTVLPQVQFGVELFGQMSVTSLGKYRTLGMQFHTTLKCLLDEYWDNIRARQKSINFPTPSFLYISRRNQYITTWEMSDPSTYTWYKSPVINPMFLSHGDRLTQRFATSSNISSHPEHWFHIALSLKKVGIIAYQTKKLVQKILNNLVIK